MRDNFLLAANWVAKVNSDFFDEHGDIMWSMDNAAIHNCDDKAMERELGISKPGQGNRLALPPNSGDMHLVIERAHARAGLQFQDRLLRLGRVLTIEEYKDMFRQAFYDANKPEQVQGDIASLPALYEAIVAGHGEYVAQKKLR